MHPVLPTQPIKSRTVTSVVSPQKRQRKQQITPMRSNHPLFFPFRLFPPRHQYEGDCSIYLPLNVGYVRQKWACIIMVCPWFHSSASVSLLHSAVSGPFYFAVLCVCVCMHLLDKWMYYTAATLFCSTIYWHCYIKMFSVNHFGGARIWGMYKIS